MKDNKIQLPDGRFLAYSDDGPQDGAVVIHCHGSNSSRLERPLEVTMLHQNQIRLIVPDRPGHGLSSPQPARTLLHWAQDVAQLADALNLAKFAVTGYSAGGPHAAAVAHYFPQRITRLGLVSSLAPFDRPGAFTGVPFGSKAAIWLTQQAIGLLRSTAKLQARAVTGNIDRTVAQLAKTLPPKDRELLNDPAIYQLLANTIQEAYRQGGKGPVDDSRVYANSWGFALRDIHIPTVIWQGLVDETAVPAMGHYLASEIPDAHLIELPEEGHLMLYRHWEAIINEMVKTEPLRSIL
jgi:pimeloyl-ACP methyl ester carboxylesterase